MMIKASGCPALVLAAGLLVLLASPVQAATDGDNSAPDSKSSTPAPVTHRTFKHASHHQKSDTHPKLHTIAEKTDTDKKAAVADAAPDNNKTAAPDVPPSIANANAQMLLAGAQVSAAAAIPPGTGATATASDGAASTNTDNGTVVVAADQLNDADRTLQESRSTPTAPPSSTPPAPTTTMTSESSIWGQTTLIGKIFIGFGALLTMASAARMFIT